MTFKGRHWVLLWLLLFVLVAGAVVTRQTASYAVATRLRTLREERLTLEARRADVQRQIREASSRQVLGKVAEERLGLHHPADSEFTLLRLPASSAGRR